MYTCKLIYVLQPGVPFFLFNPSLNFLKFQLNSVKTPPYLQHQLSIDDVLYSQYFFAFAYLISFQFKI